MASLVASWSKDPSTKCGCVIVDSDNNQIGSGYNGFPKGMEDTRYRYADRAFKNRHVKHAEENTLLTCRLIPDGCHVYVTHPPCTGCLGSLRQKKIFTVVAYEPTEDFASRWDQEECSELAQELGISVLLLPRIDNLLSQSV